ncbi:hypothetical protein LDENG_00129610 [Lucifuga dentata]|nr:hypothetical protein LDENG_00129610 [Lucifuga dentata]
MMNTRRQLIGCYHRRSTAHRWRSSAGLDWACSLTPSSVRTPSLILTYRASLRAQVHTHTQLTKRTCCQVKISKLCIFMILVAKEKKSFLLTFHNKSLLAVQDRQWFSCCISQPSIFGCFRLPTWKNALERHLKSELRLRNSDQNYLPRLTQYDVIQHGSAVKVSCVNGNDQLTGK